MFNFYWNFIGNFGSKTYVILMCFIGEAPLTQFKNHKAGRYPDRRVVIGYTTGKDRRVSDTPKTQSGQRKDRDEDTGTIVAGRYRVKRLIARGGMAVVYLAEHIQLNREVALKVLRPPADAEDPKSFEDRFQLEAQTLAQLDHPNIVTLHDYGETEDGRFYLAMEYVGGPRISQLLRKGPMEPQRVLDLTEQVCNAISYAHKKGIIHRDLKPSNLLIREDEDGNEQVKVVDFGLVKLISTDQAITRAGLIVGSPHCMAPEQVRGQDVDVRTDIYAIGVMMFRGVTGQYPFHGSNPSATMIAHINEALPPLSTVMPDLMLPQGFERMVRRCLEKRPGARFQTADDLLEEIQLCKQIPPDSYESVSDFDTTMQTGTLSSPSNATGIAVAAVGSTAIIAMAIGAIALVALWLWAPWQVIPPEPVPEPVPKETIELTVPQGETTSITEGTPPTTDSESDKTETNANPTKAELPNNSGTNDETTRQSPPTTKPSDEILKDKPLESSKETGNGTAASSDTTQASEKIDETPKAAQDEKEDEETKDTPEGYLGLPDFD